MGITGRVNRVNRDTLDDFMGFYWKGGRGTFFPSP
jgi:hypothetical protein